jgi:serine/threonine-protein kinase
LLARALPWKPGLEISRRYRLRDRIGTGASAEVWRAHDAVLDAFVAIKLLDPCFSGTPISKRFLREARAAANIRSLHVVQILDHGLHADAPFIVMELLEGETLADRLDRVGKLPPEEALRVVGQIAKAMQKAHAAQIVHRDLKPANVFLVADDDAESTVIKVFDFGIAKVTAASAASKTGLTKAGTLLGTPEYMSPEQAKGRSVDFRSDLYALGVLAFECFTGKLPFGTSEVSEILELAVAGELLRPSQIAMVPPGFDAWFARATAFDPRKRFASAKEMAAALGEIVI